MYNIKIGNRLLKKFMIDCFKQKCFQLLFKKFRVCCESDVNRQFVPCLRSNSTTTMTASLINKLHCLAATPTTDSNGCTNSTVSQWFIAPPLNKWKQKYLNIAKYFISTPKLEFQQFIHQYNWKFGSRGLPEKNRFYLIGHPITIPYFSLCWCFQNINWWCSSKRKNVKAMHNYKRPLNPQLSTVIYPCTIYPTPLSENLPS